MRFPLPGDYGNGAAVFRPAGGRRLSGPVRLRQNACLNIPGVLRDRRRFRATAKTPDQIDRDNEREINRLYRRA